MNAVNYLVNCKQSNVLIELGGALNSKQRVFDYMLRSCGNWNRFVAKQGVMADELNVTRQTISRILKFLAEGKYIARQGKDQCNIVFMLDPSKNWKGSKKDQQAAIHKFNRLVGKMSDGI